MESASDGNNNGGMKDMHNSLARLNLEEIIIKIKIVKGTRNASKILLMIITGINLVRTEDEHMYEYEKGGENVLVISCTKWIRHSANENISEIDAPVKHIQNIRLMTSFCNNNHKMLLSRSPKNLISTPKSNWDQ